MARWMTSAATSAERRSPVRAMALVVLVVTAMWLAVFVTSNVAVAPRALDGGLPRGPMLSPQRWYVGTEAAAAWWDTDDRSA